MRELTLRVPTGDEAHVREFILTNYSTEVGKDSADDPLINALMEIGIREEMTATELAELFHQCGYTAPGGASILSDTTERRSLGGKINNFKNRFMGIHKINVTGRPGAKGANHTAHTETKSAGVHNEFIEVRDGRDLTTKQWLKVFKCPKVLKYFNTAMTNRGEDNYPNFYSAVIMVFNK